MGTPLPEMLIQKGAVHSPLPLLTQKMGADFSSPPLCSIFT